MRALAILAHAAIVALILAALLRWEASPTAKILVGAFGGSLLYLLSMLEQQLERLSEIHGTLRLILSRESRLAKQQERADAARSITCYVTRKWT